MPVSYLPLILGLVDIVAETAIKDQSRKASYDAARARVQAMIEAGRDPTPEEVALQLAEIDALMAQIRAS
jgi:hypothetical protein